MSANPFAQAAANMAANATVEASTVGTITGAPLRNVQEDYEIGKVLGTGAFATVREGTHRVTGEKVALKIISGNKFKRNKRTENILRNEIHIMGKVQSDVNHPSLMGLLCTYEEQSRLVLVLEHLSGGELFDRIVQRGHYSEQDASSLMLQLMSAMAALHEHGILHRDMKPENCIYMSPDSDQGIKITDFGLASMDEAQGGLGDVHHSLVGTPGYVAPEVLDTRTYTPACDVWGMGVILYILLVGYPPFWAEDNNELFEVIKRGDYEFHEDAWGEISDAAKDLVSKMLTVDMNTRLTSAQVLQHPWIAQSGVATDAHLPNTIQRLVSFNARRKFKAAAMACVLASQFGVKKLLGDLLGTSSFNPEELSGIKAAFREAAAEDGFITESKFVTVMTELGYDHHPLDRMYRIFDRDGDNQVDYKEFLLGLGLLKKKGESTTKFLFDIYDEDGSGSISREELAKVLLTVASDEEREQLINQGGLHDIFEKIDTNHDNQISFDEFKTGIQGVPMLVRQFLQGPSPRSPRRTTPLASATARSCGGTSCRGSCSRCIGTRRGGSGGSSGSMAWAAAAAAGGGGGVASSSVRCDGEVELRAAEATTTTTVPAAAAASVVGKRTRSLEDDDKLGFLSEAGSTTSSSSSNAVLDKNDDDHGDEAHQRSPLKKARERVVVV